MDDPLAMYMNDIATIPANLAGVPRLRRRIAGRSLSKIPSSKRSFRLVWAYPGWWRVLWLRTVLPRLRKDSYF